MTCRECKFGVFQDYGYSNYTVEGTDFNCAKRMHPHGEFEPTFDDDERLKFANDCHGYAAGNAVDLCVGDGAEDLAPEQKEVYALHLSHEKGKSCSE